MKRFDKAIIFILSPDIEGGYSNDLADRGGPTNLGITQRTYNEYLRMKGLPERDVMFITKNHAVEAYRMLFWDVVQGDALPSPVDIVVFDAAVQHSPNRAGLMLQAALGFTGTLLTGFIRERTLAAATAHANPTGIAENIIASRRAFYTEIAKRDETQVRFYAGWMNRMDKLSSVIQPGGTFS